MKSFQVIVDSGNSPKTIPLDARGGVVGISATPTAATYSVTFTTTPLNQGLTLNTFQIQDMTSTASAANNGLDAATAIIVTLDSGTSVTMDLTQSDR